MTTRAPIPRVVDSYGGVPCTYVRPDDAPNRPGEVCGEIHEFCTAHRKSRNPRVIEFLGDPCRKNAAVGMLVCRYHGAATASSKAKGARVVAEQQATAAVNKRLGRADTTPVTDPAGELARLAGEVVAWKDATMALVAGLEQAIASGDDETIGLLGGGIVTVGSSGLDMHPFVKLNERAQERAIKMLAEMMKLGFVERHIQLEEAQADALQAALVAVLTDHGIDPTVVLPDLAARLHAIEAQATEVP